MPKLKSKFGIEFEFHSIALAFQYPKIAQFYSIHDVSLDEICHQFKHNEEVKEICVYFKMIKGFEKIEIGLCISSEKLTDISYCSAGWGAGRCFLASMTIMDLGFDLMPGLEDNHSLSFDRFTARFIYAIVKQIHHFLHCDVTFGVSEKYDPTCYWGQPGYTGHIFRFEKSESHEILILPFEENLEIKESEIWKMTWRFEKFSNGK